MTERAAPEHDAAELLPLSLWRLLAFGPVIGVLSGTFAYLLQRSIDPRITQQPLGQYVWVVTFNIFAWTSWLAFVPLSWWLATRVRIAGPRRFGAAAVHVAAGFAIAAAHCLMSGTIQWILLVASGQPTLDRNPAGVTWLGCVKRVTLFAFEWEVLLYWGIVGLAHAVHFHRELRMRDVREAQLRAGLVEARLEALQRQLHPHFIFNTLNAVAGLVGRDAAAAEAMIVRLGDLLRAVFQADVQQEVPLARELALTQQYLEIQRAKFGAELLTSFNVPPDLRQALVPLLLLQPLVENSFKHGLQRRSGGRIRVTARRLGSSRLEITVSDNGMGPTAGTLQQLNEGVGLSNTRARLEHLYPGEHAIAFSIPEDGGFAVALSLPLRLAAAGALTGLPRPA